MDLDQWRVANGYFNTAGRFVETEHNVRAALHSSLSGVETPDPGDDSRLGGQHQDGPDLIPTWFVKLGSTEPLQSPALLTLEDGSEVTAAESLPPDLPLGAHRLLPMDGGPTTNLFVVPSRGLAPSRCWGWSSQLYATRSKRSWGHGDFSDLASLAGLASSQGAEVVAHNPLGSTLPLPRQEPSPYFTSSRRFLSVLYMDVSEVAGAEMVSEVLDTLTRAARDLNRRREIDRDRVFSLKLTALNHIWEAVRMTEAVRRTVRSVEQDLRTHSVFCALAESFGSGWTGWPSEFRRPDSASVERFAADNSGRVEFWCWVHTELELQLARAANAGAGLMGDLPVGFDPNGSDAWVDQDLLALDCRIGAPGDDFNPDGQDWGVTPYIPWKLRNTGYEPWLRTLRRTLASCAALRIDHVMGLFRLFWLPSSATAEAVRGGAYVYQYGTELLDLALMEATRAGVWLAGEDLGTVEDDVRSAMTERGVLGYRVAWFEDDDPSGWPIDSIGSLNTHDLPTTAGLLESVEVGSNHDQSRDPLLERLARLSPETDDADRMPEDVIVAAHASLAAAGSSVVLASLDDSQAVVEQPNHPGTVDEFQNWKLALPHPLEEFDSTLAPQIAKEMQRERN